MISRHNRPTTILLNPLTLSYPSGRQINYGYDAVDRLTASPTYITKCSVRFRSQIQQRKPDHRIHGRNGAKETFTYNNRLQLATQKAQIGTSTTVADLSYSYAGSSGDHGAGTSAGKQAVSFVGMTDNNDSTKSVAYNTTLLNRLKTAQAGSSGWSVKEVYDDMAIGGSRTG